MIDHSKTIELLGLTAQAHDEQAANNRKCRDAKQAEADSYDRAAQLGDANAASCRRAIDLLREDAK